MREENIKKLREVADYLNEFGLADSDKYAKSLLSIVEKAELQTPVGFFYNRPREGRIGVEWCCDHLEDGAALYTWSPE